MVGGGGAASRQYSWSWVYVSPLDRSSRDLALIMNKLLHQHVILCLLSVFILFIWFIITNRSITPLKGEVTFIPTSCAESLY